MLYLECHRQTQHHLDFKLSLGSFRCPIHFEVNYVKRVESASTLTPFCSWTLKTLPLLHRTACPLCRKPAGLYFRGDISGLSVL
jgi:hypothetical protein